MNAWIARHPLWTGVALAAIVGTVSVGVSLAVGDRDVSIWDLFRLLWVVALPTFMARFRARVQREDAQAQGKPPPVDDSPPLSAARRRFLQVAAFGPAAFAAAGGIIAIAIGEFAVGAGLLLITGVSVAATWGLLQDL